MLDELKNKSVVELKQSLTELSDELFKLKLLHGSGQLEKTHRLSELKKNIARVHTLIKQKS